MTTWPLRNLILQNTSLQYADDSMGEPTWCVGSFEVGGGRELYAYNIHTVRSLGGEELVSERVSKRIVHTVFGSISHLPAYTTKHDVTVNILYILLIYTYASRAMRAVYTINVNVNQSYIHRRTRTQTR